MQSLNRCSLREGLPEKAAAEGLTPLQYMRTYGAVEISADLYGQDERPLTSSELDGAEPDANGVLRKPVAPQTHKPLVGEAGAVGIVMADGAKAAGWLTPSRKLELYSTSMRDFGWSEYATPCHVEMHVHHRGVDQAKGELVLVPTFRLPTLIHTRSGMPST